MKLNYFSSASRERVLKALLRSKHEIENLFVTDPSRWPGVSETIEVAKQAGIPVRIVRKSDLTSLSFELKGSNCLSAAFGYLFPAEFIRSVSLCLNVHGTLLPKYAGARTLNWVLENAELRSGVTVHRVDEGVDTGDILLQRSFALSPFETSRSIARKTLEFEPKVVLEALDRYEAGEIDFIQQDFEGVIRYPDRVPRNSELDTRSPLAELFDKIRAADPEKYPAYFYWCGEKVCVRLWRPEKPDDENDLI